MRIRRKMEMQIGFTEECFDFWERFRQQSKAQKSLTKGRKLPLAESTGAAPQTTTFCARYQAYATAYSRNMPRNGKVAL
jgi:hypothetical protein